MVMSGPGRVKSQQTDGARGMEHSTEWLGCEERAGQLFMRHLTGNDAWHPGSFYMLPPVWKAQNQQVAAPGRVKGKGRFPTWHARPSGIKQLRCGGKQEQRKVWKKASQGSKAEGPCLRPIGSCHGQCFTCTDSVSLSACISWCLLGAFFFFFLHSGRMTNFKD